MLTDSRFYLQSPNYTPETTGWLNTNQIIYVIYFVVYKKFRDQTNDYHEKYQEMVVDFFFFF